MWDSGFQDYVDDWWNLMDFIMNSLYIATISLKIVAYVKVLYDKNIQIKPKFEYSCIANLCSISFSFVLVLLYSTVVVNPGATGKCGTQLWWLRHRLPLPTSSALCASFAFSLPIPI